MKTDGGSPEAAPEPEAAAEQQAAWPLWCTCGEPVVLMARTAHPLQMRTECCEALYELRPPRWLVLLEPGRGAGLISQGEGRSSNTGGTRP